MVGVAKLVMVGALVVASAVPAVAATGDGDAAPSRRPRITVYPRQTYPGPNAQRQCKAWLAKEYRVSGTVVVPRMRCWWR